MNAQHVTPSTATMKILVVDDDVMITTVLRDLLACYDVTVLNNPHQAADLLETVRFDVLVTDYRMPGMTGVELCQVKNLVQPLCKSLMLTGETRTAGFQDVGCIDALLSKPPRWTVLLGHMTAWDEERQAR